MITKKEGNHNLLLQLITFRNYASDLSCNTTDNEFSQITRQLK